jgi:hypothetical protein
MAIIRSFGTEEVDFVDAACILFGKFRDASGVVSGIFQISDLEMCIRQNADGSFVVFPYCYFDSFDRREDEIIIFGLLVPKHGLIKLPNYSGLVISNVEVIDA